MMKYFRKEMKNIRPDTAILSVLLLYFIVAGFHLPNDMAHIIDNPAGKLLLVLLVLMLFMRSVFLGVLGMILAFDLIRKAEHKTGTAQERLFLPNDEDKGRVFTALNQFPETIEQEVIARMVPQVHE